MRTVSLTERSSTLEIHTYAFAIRTALRKAKVFLPSNTLAGLRLPPGALMDAYKDAVETVLKLASAERYIITMVRVAESTGETDLTDALYLSRYKAALIVLIQNQAEVPSELSLSLDRIVDVQTVNARHLVEAAKSAVALDMPLEMARKLVAFPADKLFLALRPGRPFDTVLEKLEADAASERKPIPKIQPQLPRLEELEGYGAAKDWARDLVWDMKEWNEGRIAWTDVGSGMLLSGPSGTGKTMFAEVVARACGAELIATSGAVWQSAGHLGDMLKAMRRSFAIAAKSAPAVLLIDEIDAIGDRAKFKGSNSDYNIQVVNGLLELLDGSGGREGVVVIGTTNYPDMVDAALKRAGRLDRHMAIDLPDSGARQRIIALHLGTDRASADELDVLGAATSGCSGAQIRQLVSDAKRRARRQGRDVLASDLIEMIPIPRPLTETDRRIASVHEVGHAIVGLELLVAEIEYIAVLRHIGRDRVQGYVRWRKVPPLFRGRQSYADELAMLLGGIAAEQVMLGQQFDGSGIGQGSDLHRASDLATVMVASMGMGAKLSYIEGEAPEELSELRRLYPDLRREVEGLLAEALGKARQIVERRRADGELILEMLADREVVTRDELREMGLVVR